MPDARSSLRGAGEFLVMLAVAALVAGLGSAGARLATGEDRLVILARTTSQTGPIGGATAAFGQGGCDCAILLSERGVEPQPGEVLMAERPTDLGSGASQDEVRTKKRGTGASRVKRDLRLYLADMARSSQRR